MPCIHYVSCSKILYEQHFQIAGRLQQLSCNRVHVEMHVTHQGNDLGYGNITTSYANPQPSLLIASCKRKEEGSET